MQVALVLLMARPLRVTSRGDRRDDILVDDEDRHALLRVVAQGMDRFSAQVLAYCLMGNRYHFVLHTREANLSRLMRHIKGVYTQAFDRRHGKVGHLFQGRFKAVLFDRDAYLLEVCRYVELNPMRAGMAMTVAEWPWSSYRAHAGQADTPPWLNTIGLHGYLLGREPAGRADHRTAARRYERLVAEGLNVDLWTLALSQQIFLGDDEFVARMQALASQPNLRDRTVPKAQRSPPRRLHQWLKVCATREEALRNAYVHSGLSMTAMATELDLTVARVSQLIARAEAQDAAGDQ
jgi:putative transposase